ncbi:uncharacterized protein LAESUDRAFT_76239 [Laetiporus sulphureus 93-53]|uniref:Uncharacterized protein n=1 Tax=Laetiporus sulphureus 93-53 TaxID=1314785 RepID=A0A165F0P0_9APHY|nr:uncharacterized protein LAESUDRAFT_76239 [Laetiporus sulphureus 93-53]KZT08115.1 hypothetical protein LAESUDRAFT_76239 [Laetiporus sulphureus 93-53]
MIVGSPADASCIRGLVSTLAMMKCIHKWSAKISAFISLALRSVVRSCGFLATTRSLPQSPAPHTLRSTTHLCKFFHPARHIPPFPSRYSDIYLLHLVSAPHAPPAIAHTATATFPLLHSLLKHALSAGINPQGLHSSQAILVGILQATSIQPFCRLHDDIGDAHFTGSVWRVTVALGLGE